MRWKKLPGALFRRHPVATMLTAAAALSALLAVTGWGLRDDAPPEATAGRAILNRIWFERYPTSAREELASWIWLAGGVGIYENGSLYRTHLDIFEFERHGERVEMRFLHDGEEARTPFTIEACDDAPPFDLCLTLERSPRGPARYYSFGDLDEMEERLPWAARRLARAR